jgi:NADH-quinone oxidoreductase subunit H
MPEGPLIEYLNNIPMFASLGPALTFTAAAFIVMNVIMIGVITPYNLFIIWLERKVAGHIQDRLGPMVPGGWHGWAATIADGLKLLLKEDLIPEKADNFLFWLAPMLTFAGAFAIYVVVPWGPGMVPADLDIGIFYVVAVSSLSTLGIIMAGWASNNKYALYGGMRSAAQAVSFEIPLILSVVPIAMFGGSLNLVKITNMQANGLLEWNVFAFFPFMFIGFFVFFISALAEVNRTPFDMPEGDQEIVGGFHVEYSGIRFGMFFLGEYASMLAVGLIASILFLGGWHGAWAVMGMTGTAVATLAIIVVWLGANAVIEQLDANFKKSVPLRIFNGIMGVSIFAVPMLFGMGPVTIMVKGVFFVFVMLWLRWTLPRVRPDQLMHTCWKVLLPLAFVNLIAIAGWMYWLS